VSRTWRGIAGRRDLGTRLLVAMVVVVIVGGATAGVVAVGIGPAIFSEHMARASDSSANVALHAQEAFRTASALSLALALAAALLASVLVSVVVTQRIARSLAPVTRAAGRVAGGDYTARVPAVGMGTEFDELAGAFNTMAADLGQIELSRSQMLGDLAHEMRTPVTTLAAYLEAIAEGVERADAQTLAMLSDQVARLARLSEDIALVTTAEEGRLTMRRSPVVLADIVREVAAQAAARFTASGVDLEVRVSPVASSVCVDADVDRIAQVFTNLLDNAGRHTPAGGHVQLTVDRLGAVLRVVVADDGQGIPAEHLPHVFDRFYRVDTARDRAHGGSGVGLAIAKAISEAHGGTITAGSEGSGRGAVFTVALPVVPAVAGQT
jgi:two-component system, OmpR family, sensor histidine kinase BaeS